MIYLHAAALVVSSGSDGDRIPCDIYAEGKTLVVDIGESANYEISVHVCHIEQDVFITGFLQFRIDGLGDNIPRCQTLHGVIFFHESGSVS